MRFRRPERALSCVMGPLLAAALLAAAVYPGAQRWRKARALAAAVQRAQATVSPSAACEVSLADEALPRRLSRMGALLASWETVGGCGAGSSTGVGGIKWVR